MSGFGVASVHTHEVVNGLLQQGHKVVLISADKTQDDDGMRPQKLSFWSHLRALVFYSPKVPSPLRGLIIGSWITFHEIILFSSASVAIIRHKEKFDVLYRRASLLNSQYFLAKIFHIPLVEEVNGIASDEARVAKQGFGLLWWIASRIENFSLSKADAIIVVTPNLKNILHQKYRIKEDKITIIANGADTELFKPMDSTQAKQLLGLSPDKHYICFVGSLTRWQGVEDLITSFSVINDQFPETRLLIVGDGEMKPVLITLTQNLNLADKVIFTGMASHSKIPLYMNASDICAAPKKGLESGYSPLKLFEYMACGKAVVASRASGLEIIEESGGGILVEPGNINELTNSIIKLYKDEYLRIKMGELGRKYIIQNQSWEIVAKKVAGVCQKLISKQSKNKSSPTTS